MTVGCQFHKTNILLLLPSPQTVRKRHFQAYYNEQSRYRDST